MGLGDNMIDQAVESALEQTDLEPGEVNQNINKVMETMDEAYDQFEDIEQHLQAIIKVASQLDENSQDMASAAIELSKASQSIAESVNQLDETSTEMKDNIENLEEVMQKFESHLPEE